MTCYQPLFVLSSHAWIKQRPTRTGWTDNFGKQRWLCSAASQGIVQKPTTDNEKKLQTKNLRKPGRLRHWAKRNARLISEVKKGDSLIGTVCEVGPAKSAWIDVNLATSGGRAVRARLRLPTKQDGAVDTDLETGAVIPVHVRRVMPDSGRLEVGRGIEPPKNLLLVDEENSRPVETLQTGEQLNGTIITVGPYGAVIDVGVHRKGRQNRIIKFPGLLPHQHFGPRWATTADSVRRADVDRVLAIGDTITVWVRLVYPLCPFLLLDGNPVDIQQVRAEQAEKKRNRRRFQRKKRVSTVSIGEQRRGFVRKVASFGLFIDLSLRRDALLHYSAMGDEYAKSWKYELTPGTSVDVEIIKIEGENVAVRLLSVTQSELDEAREKASSPSATPEDVKHALQLEKKERVVGNRTGALLERGSKEPPSGHYNGTGNQQQHEATQSDKHGDGDDEEAEEDDDDDDEDENKFSDDYFEDKYGF